MSDTHTYGIDDKFESPRMVTTHDNSGRVIDVMIPYLPEILGPMVKDRDKQTSV